MLTAGNVKEVGLVRNVANSALVLIVLIVLLLSGCSGPVREKAEEREPVSLVTTIFPLQSIVEQLGGDAVQVVNLLPPGANPHNFEPTPEQIKAACKGEMMVAVGGGLDTWAEDLVAAVPEMKIIRIHEELDIDQDPHVWLDPVLVKEKIAPHLTEKLIKLLPSRSTELQHNLQVFQEQLSVLDAEIKSEVAGWRHRQLITFHNSWMHFARRYGLELVASVEESPGKELSGRRIAQIVQLACKHGVRVIFAEPQFNAQLAETISKEIGGHVLLLDPLGGEQVPERDSYIKLMRYNLRMMAEGMQ